MISTPFFTRYCLTLAAAVMTSTWYFAELLSVEPRIDQGAESRRTLATNMTLPLLLGEDSQTLVRRSESLIQNTEIRQIRLYANDGQLLASIDNKAIMSDNPNILRDRFPVLLQNNVAGTIQLDWLPPGDSRQAGGKEPTLLNTPFKIALATTASSLVIFIALSYGYLLLKTNSRLPRLPPGKPNDSGPVATSSSSRGLNQDTPPAPLVTKKEMTAGDLLIVFTQGLENNEPAYNREQIKKHLGLYQAHILGSNAEGFLCRLPSAENTAQVLQNLLLSWGVKQYRDHPKEGHDSPVNSISTLLIRNKFLDSCLPNGDLDAGKVLTHFYSMIERPGDQESYCFAFLSQECRTKVEEHFEFKAVSSEQQDLYQVLSASQSTERVWRQQMRNLLSIDANQP